MFNKKYFILILILFSLFCSIASISAANSVLTDNSNNSITNESSLQLSLSFEEGINQKVNDSSDINDDVLASNQNTAEKSKNSSAVIKKAPKVWINKMIVKSDKKLVIKLKSDKKGTIYYSTNGKKPTVHSKKYTSPITLASNKVLKFFAVSKDGSKSKVHTYKRILGKTSKGYVEKLYFGNLSSTKTIALIVGVHVQECDMHKSIYKSLIKKNNKLKRKYVLYYIHVTKDQNSYSKSRENGQILGNKFIIKDIANEKPKITTDIHETSYKASGYKYPRFIHMISNKNIKSVKISKNLHKKSSLYLKRLLKLTPHIKRYDPQLGSSPAYITVPIANKGLVSYIYETESDYSRAVKQTYADKYIKALDKVNLSFKL
ncbi:chitobiase/beta-hexosaminidase C-terminal domain-containing protein [uncultured Methanobrevibacter sp.]|uniref:chitobiase/beta-hexosaminidase C-terminal domain-containing protein n=2 Tax=uncultured Methanobrevibacter sp. TaxID=253161 RepID=UPI0025D7E98C|nr:chitobiase/beta-hexosaminidase C-terminal domain-containing protein [uncultured Methanobrevibacter sp.]